MNAILEQLSGYGVVPVVVLHRTEDAKPLAEALCKGGLKCAEITFRTEAAEESIRIMTDNYPDMLVGAGTVLTVEQVKRAVAAGARFIVSPGFDEEVVDYCIANAIPVVPGCITPSEVAKGVKRGLKLLKFFPAEQAGGLAMIRAMAAPYTDIKFMPTGGISQKNLEQYLSYEKIAACGGSWMVKAEFVENQEFDKIEKMTKQAVKLVKEIRG